MILDVQDLSFRYSKNTKPIFHNVNLQMEKGEILTILGANCAGKSTLLNCLANILEPYSGKILVNGASIHDMSLKKAAQLIGYVPQNHASVYDYSVRDFIVMGRAPHLGMLEKPSENDYAIVDEVIRELGIEKLADKAYTQISGGERQQALIGRAIAQQPEIIMFDEPTNHLDYGNQLRMVHKIKNLSKKDYTVIMTTHMPDHAMMIGGKTAILGRDGTLKVGKTEEIITEFVGHYLTTERKKINYTQEKLSEGICSVESYSRIENGRKPSWKNYKALAEKIGVENRYYVELLNTGKIEALLLRREISRILFSEKSMDKVRESLEKLMEILGEDECAQNKQYLKFIEICIEKEYSHMSEEICCEEYRKVLAYSMNENLIGEKKHIYTKVEINLINHISVCLAKSGKKEQAMRLIRAFLEDTDQMKEDKYHETKLAKLNYGRWLSDSGEYSKADSIFMDGAKQIMERDRAELLDQYIGEIAYNKYLMNGSEKNEQIKRYSLYALVLSKLFGTDRIYKNSFNFFEKIKDE